MRCRQTYLVRTLDGVELHLKRFLRESSNRIPVLLTHGTFSNGAVCAGLAAYLAGQGYDAWVLELRGHGESGCGTVSLDFEVWSQFDVPAAIAEVRAVTGAQKVSLVGHSGGGLVFLMHLARHPEMTQEIRGLVTLASQATDACSRWGGAMTIAFYTVVNHVFGRLPGRRLGIGPEDETGSVMSQWFGWNWKKRWLGKDGFDYLAALDQVHVPLLCFAGGGDRVIAPVAGCQRLYDAVGSADKRVVVCARSNGYTEDYTHARIIASRSARREIWPQIAQWLASR
jgi:oxygen-independent coproporphyrinogen-3 oxidase